MPARVFIATATLFFAIINIIKLGGFKFEVQRDDDDDAEKSQRSQA